MNRMIPALAAAALFVSLTPLVGLATDQPVASDAPAGTMSPPEARAVLCGVGQLRLVFFSSLWKSSQMRVSAIRLTNEKLDIVGDGGRGAEFSLSDLNYSVHTSLMSLGSATVLQFTDKALYPGIFIEGGPIDERTRALTRLQTALLTLQKSGNDDGSPAAAATFQAVAQEYRASASKPVPPEEAWTFEARARAAARESRFGDAADLLAEAIKIAPWWPEAHFDRGLLLALSGDYARAAMEMRDYLALVPDAADARVALDHTNEWGGRSGQTATCDGA